MAKTDLPKVETRLYINGKWLEGSEGTFEVVNPATGKILANVQKGGESETKKAIQAAKRNKFNEISGVNNQSGTITYRYKLK